MAEVNEKGLSVVQAAELMIDVWRISRRAKRDAATPESVLIACERAMERFSTYGFRLEDMVGQAYHEGTRAQVVADDGGTQNRRVEECLSPAIYAGNRLVRQAEIIVTGK